MINAKGCGLTRMNHHSLPKRQSFMEGKLCCLYGVITMVLLILSFFFYRIQTFSLNSCKVCNKIYLENAWLSSRGKTYFFMMVQSHIQQESRRKDIWLMLIYPAPYSIFTRPCTKLFLPFYLSQVFINGPGDLGSIPGRIIPKIFKMVLDTSLLNTQQYMVKCSNPGKGYGEGVLGKE